MCQMASVIGQLCPVTFGFHVLIVFGGEQSLQWLSPSVWEYYPKTAPFLSDPLTAICSSLESLRAL